MMNQKISLWQIKKYQILFFTLCITLLSSLSYWSAIDFNFWRDDWTALWLLKFQPQYYFTTWTFSSRHPGEFLNLFPLFFLFGFNHYLWQGLGIILKIMASFAVTLAAYGFTTSKKTAMLAGILYASYFGGSEAFTWLSARLSADLIILLCLAAFFYTQSLKNHSFRFFSIALGIIFVATVIEPTRVLFIIPLIIFWEIFQGYIAQKMNIQASIVRTLALAASFIAGLLVTPFGRSLFISQNSTSYTRAAINSHNAFFIFFSSIGNFFIIYLRYFIYGESLQEFISCYLWVIGIIIILLLCLFGLFLLLRKDKDAVFILVASLWIPFLYLPSWLAETGLVSDPFHRYLALSGVGLIFLLAYFLSKLRGFSFVCICCIVISINLYQSILKINNDYNVRGYPITQKLYDIQESEVPQNFTNGLFWVEGDNGLRGSAFDWSLSGTIPFALKRNIGKFELVPTYGVDLDFVKKIVCQKNTNRPTITTWILQKEPISISKIYAWRVTYDGKLINITNPFRNSLVKTTPCLEIKHS